MNYLLNTQTDNIVSIYTESWCKIPVHAYQTIIALLNYLCQHLKNFNVVGTKFYKICLLYYYSSSGIVL